MRTLFTIFLTIFLNSILFGTAQTSDILIYNGKKYELYCNPLEKYFKKYPNKHPNNLIGENDVRIESSDLWRGYVATFEIIENQLYLKDIEIESVSDTSDIINSEIIWKSVLNKVFTNQELVKVDWMTGLLIIPDGEIVNYVHMGYVSTFERYIILEIDEGNLKRETRLEHEEYDEFREKQFIAFKKTDDYKKKKAKMQENGYDVEFIDSFLQVFEVEYLLINKKEEE